jgi:hypothetical protein
MAQIKPWGVKHGGAAMILLETPYLAMPAPKGGSERTPHSHTEISIMGVCLTARICSVHLCGCLNPWRELFDISEVSGAPCYSSSPCIHRPEGEQLVRFVHFKRVLNIPVHAANRNDPSFLHVTIIQFTQQVAILLGLVANVRYYSPWVQPLKAVFPASRRIWALFFCSIPSQSR